MHIALWLCLCRVYFGMAVRELKYSRQVARQVQQMLV